MLKFLFLILVLSSSFVLAQSPVEARRKQIIGIVNEELKELNRLARQQENKSPDTLLRISELNLEKARLYRESENERYLAVPPEKRRNLNRKEYFKISNKLFARANSSAALVVKRFPKYKNIGDVYYILAYNHKELGNHAEAQKYFQLSAKRSPSKSKLYYKSRLALADYYFNDSKYKQAVPLYESAINHVDERWWTKDAFNLAWSYYRLKNYDKAISLMKEVHRKSSDSKYIDMRSMVERDIGVFFVDAGKMNDAIEFYTALGINYTQQFVKIANVIISQGRFSQAEALSAEAAKSEKDRERKIEIYLSQLDLFDKYNKIVSHLRVSKLLVEIHLQSPLNADQKKQLTYHVNKKAAELQKATASDIYANVPKVKARKSKQSIAYFDLSAKLTPEEKAEKVFFQGETAYAATSFHTALGYYVTAFDVSRETNNKKILTQSLEGMLASLGQPGLNITHAEKYYVPVYTRYLTVDSKSDRAKSIFVKLFNTQFDKKDVPAAEATLERFALNFPSDYKTQEGMLAKIMEHYRKQKKYSEVKAYVADINSGKYKVSKKYAEALRNLMTKIQIEGVQESLEKGEKGVAMKGYHQIYNNPESTDKAKVNAAYNLSALYYELGDSNQSYQWGVTAVKDMDTQDVNKFADSFLSISAGLFLKQHFSQSSDLSYRVLAKLCKQKSNNKIVAYKNAAFIALANGEIDKTIEIKDFGKGCDIPDAVVAEVSLELLKDLALASRWEIYEKTISELENNPKNHPHLIRPYEEMRKKYLGVGETTQAGAIYAKQERFFKQARAQKADIPVEALDLMAERLINGLLDKKQRLDQIALRFPENDFNNAVKLKLQILDQLTSTVNEIQKIGSGKGIVEAYRIVIEAYESFGNSLKTFVPEGKSPEYVASFQKAMSEVYDPILKNANKQRSEVRKLIVENKILSESNYSVLYGAEESFKRYFTDKTSVLMDRGGRN